MKDSEIYTSEELKMIEEIEKGDYASLPNDELEKEKAMLKQVAINTIEDKKRKKSLNIRLFENDIQRIKAMALSEGLPYQTFLSSIIHKIATGKIRI